MYWRIMQYQLTLRSHQGLFTFSCAQRNACIQNYLGTSAQVTLLADFHLILPDIPAPSA